MCNTQKISSVQGGNIAGLSTRNAHIETLEPADLTPNHNAKNKSKKCEHMHSHLNYNLST